MLKTKTESNSDVIHVEGTKHDLLELANRLIQMAMTDEKVNVHLRPADSPRIPPPTTMFAVQRHNDPVPVQVFVHMSDPPHVEE